MKIMTFNVLHFMDYTSKKIDFQKFADEIKAIDADIIGLNEVRGKGFLRDYTNQLKKISALTGYDYYFGKAISVGSLAPYGNGFLTRKKLISAETVKIPDPVEKTGDNMYESRSIIKTVIGENEKYTVLVTHMGLNIDERENAVKTLLKLAPDKKCIIMGDFNSTPDQKELAPLFEKYICSDTKDLTFPSDKPRIKIDYIFVSEDIKIKSCGTSENVVSDHLAQWIEIEEN